MDPEERRKKHELNYGVYNFRDVKNYFTREGWHATTGPALSYDHYYVKPGKNPRNPEDVEGEDYFLGEAALVAYARKMKIFGPEAEPVVPVAYGSRRGKRRARRTSQMTVDFNSDSDNKSDRSHQTKHERKRKRHKRRLSKNKIGNSALNPIALSSDSSGAEETVADITSSVDDGDDEEWTERDTKGGFNEEEEEDDDDEEEEEDDNEADALYSSLSSSSDEVETEDLEDDDMEIAVSSKTLVKPPQGESYAHVETQRAKQRRNGKSNAEAKTNVRNEKKSPRSVDTAEDRGPRPLLKTSQGKHKKKMKRQKENDSINHSTSSSKEALSLSNSKPHSEKRSCGVMHTSKMHFHKRTAKKVKSSSRSLLERLKMERPKNVEHGRWEDNDDNSFDLGVEQYGESPPRRPPTRAHSIARSNGSKNAPPSPATSAVTASPPPDASAVEDETPPAPSLEEKKRSPVMVQSNSNSFLSASNRAGSPRQASLADSPNHATSAGLGPPTRVSVSSRRVGTLYRLAVSPPHLANNEDDTASHTSMELTHVVLPPDRDNKYHIRVTLSSAKPPVTTIWMENLTSLEQRSYSFTDIQELPGAKTDLRVPTATVLTALFRSLSSQPDAVVVIGPEPRATAESKTAFEKGEVELRTSTAEKSTGDNSAGDSGLTLVVAYPALDLFRVEHNFPMELVSSDQQLQHLAHELERMREQLALVQTDRDKLCEQLRQQEEENECALSLQVEAKVKARLERGPTLLSNDEMERRLEELVQEKVRSIQQAQEREKRDRDRARRWVYARSDWMTAFHPCRALIAAATGGGGETSLLRPTAATVAATVQKYVVEWHEIVEIAEPLFQPIAARNEEPPPRFTRFVTVVKDGLYQVNVNVSHDSLVQMRLVISPGGTSSAAAVDGDSGGGAATAAVATREIEPTKVLLYDNKRRVSRVDQTLYLRALDQISVELRLQALAGPGSRPEDWVRTPMPAHNRLMVQVLDEHQHSLAG